MLDRFCNRTRRGADASASFRSLVVGAIWFLLPVTSAWAQGCIVARSSTQGIGPESQADYLEPSDFEVSVGYRHQFSYKHFVGNVEQTYRVQQGTQVENKINLENVNANIPDQPPVQFYFKRTIALREQTRQ